MFMLIARGKAGADAQNKYESARKVVEAEASFYVFFLKNLLAAFHNYKSD